MCPPAGPGRGADRPQGQAHSAPDQPAAAGGGHAQQPGVLLPEARQAAVGPEDADGCLRGDKLAPALSRAQHVGGQTVARCGRMLRRPAGLAQLAEHTSAQHLLWWPAPRTDPAPRRCCPQVEQELGPELVEDPATTLLNICAVRETRRDSPNAWIASVRMFFRVFRVFS